MSDDQAAPRLVLDAEASFLLLMARRTLNFVKKAQADGETYHDLRPRTDLQCGYAVKMTFEPGPAGVLRPVVAVSRASVHHVIEYTAEGRLRVAAEVLGDSATPLDQGDDVQTFCLTKDK